MIATLSTLVVLVLVLLAALAVLWRHRTDADERAAKATERAERAERIAAADAAAADAAARAAQASSPADDAMLVTALDNGTLTYERGQLNSRALYRDTIIFNPYLSLGAERDSQEPISVLVRYRGISVRRPTLREAFAIAVKADAASVETPEAPAEPTV